jgi:hypothetical protein
MTDQIAKQKVSLSLDADLISELERSGPLSPQVNEALRLEVKRRRQRAALEALIGTITEKYGELDSPEDRAAIERYVELLS